jgi:type II secretory pathway pseudopilin PulG
MTTLQNAKNKAASGNTKEAFKNEAGAIDLASIMVGIIVIGLIGGVIAATVFAVIPWAQDNAAKQQVDAVVTAQSAYKGLSVDDSLRSKVTGFQNNKYASQDQLSQAGLFTGNINVVHMKTVNVFTDYVVVVKSSSGQYFEVDTRNSMKVVNSNEAPGGNGEARFIGAGGVSA